MLHSFFASSGPLVFAHRGGSALAPENTLAAFANGLALGADGIELDVHLSRDGAVVVHHDRMLDRTTSLRGDVRERTADELRRADVPGLAEVLSAHPDARVIVELKVNSPEMAQGVVDVVRRAGAVDRVCIGSFGTRVLRTVRALEPAIATSASREEVRWALYRSWITRASSRAGGSTRAGGSGRYVGFQIPELAGSTRVVSRRFIQAAHNRGLGVQVWTVDLAEDARRLLEWGVDGLITDRPDIIVPMVRAHRLPTI
jgi:glycerophosphoryl diester phosphodiesterase